MVFFKKKKKEEGNQEIFLDNRRKICYYILARFVKVIMTGCSAAGSVLDWGSRGRRFKSCHWDHAEYHF